MLAISRGDLPLPRAAGHRRPALPRPRHARALRARRAHRVEVLAAHGVDVIVDAATAPRRRPSSRTRSSPTTAAATAARADGIVVTPSHNPPEDGGFKYNPPHGGPADTDVTGWIEREANALLEGGLRDVQRPPAGERREPAPPRLRLAPTSATCRSVIDLDAIRAAGCGSASTRSAARASPTGGRSPSATGSTSRSSTTRVDPTFRFVPLDWDGKIRMDCSSPHAMARPDRAARTASTSPSPTTPTPTATGSSRATAGLMNPNHYLAACIAYLFGGHRDWPPRRARRQDARLQRDDRPRRRGPRPARWSRSPSASSGSSTACSTARSASAARRAPAPRSCAATARAWSTDKDGLIPCLLAAEITATHRHRPGRSLRRARRALRHARLPAHRRAATPAQKTVLAAALARAGRRAPSSRASRSTRCSPRRRATARRSAASRSCRRARLVRRAARRARRTSTSSTRRASHGEEHLERILAEARGARRRRARGGDADA